MILIPISQISQTAWDKLEYPIIDFLAQALHCEHRPSPKIYKGVDTLLDNPRDIEPLCEQTDN